MFLYLKHKWDYEGDTLKPWFKYFLFELLRWDNESLPIKSTYINLVKKLWTLWERQIQSQAMWIWQKPYRLAMNN